MDVKYAISVPIAMLVFFFAIVIDYYVVTAIGPMINLLAAEPVIYAMAWGGVIILVGVITIGAPIMTATLISDFGDGEDD